jgi:hypothetical protein
MELAVSNISFCRFQLFRVQPGDVGIPDFPSTDVDLEAAVRTLGEALLAHFNDVVRPADRRPHHGRFVLGDGTIYAEMMVVPGNSGFKIERTI